jgi:hypothetical protein
VEDEPLFVDDIRQAIRERRISAATAAEWLRLRQEEHARQVRAHATQRMRDRAHQALDTALSDDTPDPFAHLFPPHAPLGPATHEEEISQTLVYGPPGEQGKRPKPRPAASAMSDDELYNALFPDEYRERTWGGE